MICSDGALKIDGEHSELVAREPVVHALPGDAHRRQNTGGDLEDPVATIRVNEPDAKDEDARGVL